MSVQKRLFGIIILSCLSFADLAHAETYFLENAKADASLKDILGKVDAGALDYMLGEDKNMIGVKRASSDYILQPRVIRVGENLLIKIEKKNQAGKIISVQRVKVAKSADMNKLISKAVADAVGKTQLPQQAQH